MRPVRRPGAFVFAPCAALGLALIAIAPGARAQSGPAQTGPAQTGDACAAVAALDRGAPDGFPAQRQAFLTRAIPPSGGPFSVFAAPDLFGGGIDPRVIVPEERATTYAVRFSGGSDVAFRRFAARIDACGLHQAVEDPSPCHRDRGCARTYRFRSGANLRLSYQPAVIDLIFTAPARRQ